jgi:hypothetical protein
MILDVGVIQFFIGFSIEVWFWVFSFLCISSLYFFVVFISSGTFISGAFLKMDFSFDGWISWECFVFVVIPSSPWFSRGMPSGL